MLSMIASFIVNQANQPNGWRIPFFIGSLFATMSIYIRNKLKESFKNNNQIRTPELTKSNKKSLIVGFALSSLLGASSYINHLFFKIYLTKLNIEPQVIDKIMIGCDYDCNRCSIYL